MERTGFGFPFRTTELGQVASQAGDANIRAKIIQVLLTSPGERVQLPEFGCGLKDLVFDPNNEILAATTEYTISRALQRWLGDDVLVEDVTATQVDERLQISVTYLRRDRLERSRVKIAF
jgi:phage baseplate assembly protein W